METLIVFTNYNSLSSVLKTNEHNWRFDEHLVIPINEHCKIILARDLGDFDLDLLKNCNEIIVLYHSQTNIKNIAKIKEFTKENGLYSNPVFSNHEDQNTYGKLSQIYSSINSIKELVKCYNELKAFIVGDEILEQKLEFLHGLLGNDNFEGIEYDNLGLNEKNIKDIKTVVDGFNGLEIKTEDKSCFNPNYVRALKDIRDIVLKY